ncbi:MAG: prolyl oligopeptidase family serine peptidase [Acidobacteriota bacterium]|nr:prolyl oligopeptidase family serine peptidase [Acidobacteriota bacterium]
MTIFLTLNSFSQTKFNYPKPQKSEQTDDYFGTKVADPYRGLENSDSPETRAWINAENKITGDYLATIPERAKLKARLTELWNYEKYSAPFKQGKRYFYSKNDGLQNQSVFYVADSVTDKGRVLLDPNKLSTDGTVALSGMAISDDGNLMAYGLASAGSDWQEWHFRDVATGQDLPDVLKNIKFSGASWTKDEKGVFYSRFPEASDSSKLQAVNYYQKLYYHRLGTPQTEDALIYERPDDKEMSINGGVTEDGRWLIINVGKGTAPMNMVYYKDLTKTDSTVMPLVDKLEADYSFIGNDKSTFYFRSDKDAPTGKVIAVDVSKKDRTWREIIPQAKETLGSVDFINNQFVGNYLKDAYTQIRIYDINGKFVRNVDLPGIGTAGGFAGKRFDTETFYSYSSFNAPPTIYRYDMRTGKSEVFRKADVKFNPDDYEVKQVFYASKDGTKIPMFIVNKKGIKLDGNNPTLLYAYGGFNISLTPAFSVSRLAWLEMGGVYAVPNLRGGGEYGEEWHKAGTKLHKQNVFDDFIAAAEYLIANKYTRPAKLAISGGSNGGLLIGATLNQRPELFAAALPAVGVMDMLRFHKFTIGRAWTSDYGSSEESAEQFKAIYAYSPLHNIRRGGRYPAVLVTTADHDDRVVPAHSFKYTATLQEAQAGDAPILIRIETKAGHGAGKPTSKIIEEQADIYGFLMKNLGM